VDSQTRSEVVQLCDIFRARIVDVTPEAVIVELTGDEQKIASMVELLRPIGILEMVRTGVVAMTRGDYVLAPNTYKSGRAAILTAIGPAYSKGDSLWLSCTTIKMRT